MGGGVAAQLPLVAGARRTARRRAGSPRRSGRRRGPRASGPARSPDPSPARARLSGPLRSSIREYVCLQLRRQAGVRRRARPGAGLRRAPIQMRRLLPIFAAVTLLAAIAASTASARPQTSIAAAKGFAPREVVVKFDGQRRGRAARAAGRGHGAADRDGAARQPRVAYAEPNYIATASETVDPPYVIPNDSGSLDAGASEAAASTGAWAFKQWNFLPCDGCGDRRACRSPPAASTRSAAWRNLIDARPARSRRGHRRRARHRRRLPRARAAASVRSPDFAAGPVRPGLRLRRQRPPAARRERPRHPRRRDDRREDRQRRSA